MSRHRKRTCHGKRRYRDQAEALQTIHGIAARPFHSGRDGKAPTRAYECDRCHGWHLTSRPAR